MIRIAVCRVVAVAAYVLSAAAFAQTSPSSPMAAGAIPDVATVESSNGRVLLNRATTYRPATKGDRLQPGDRLVVLDGGAIDVRYDKGCVQSVQTPSVYTVNADQSCQASATDRGLRAAAPQTPAGGGLTTSDYLKWGLIGLGIAAPIYIIATNSQGSPVSP